MLGNESSRVNAVYVESLEADEIADIMSCLHQHSKVSVTREFHSIMILFSDVANRLFNGGTPAGGYNIRTKREQDFKSQHVLAHAKRIWAAGMVPIEVTRSTGSLFYAIPQEAFFSRDLREIVMLYAEDSIPTIDQFYNDQA
jgi:hypothetical protein